MKKSKYIILLIVILVHSCSVSNTVPIDRNAESLIVAQKENCADTLLFKSTKFVKLETGDDSQIRNINRVLTDDHKLFIFDRLRKSVFIFEDTGKFLYSINTIGLGPGEYRELYDVCLDTATKRLILYCDVPYKFLIYNYFGELIGEKKMEDIDEFINQISYANNTWFGLKNESSRLLNAIEEKTMETNCLMENPNFHKGVYVFPEGCFITQNRSVTFSNRFDNSIYEINSEGVRIQYNIDFKELNLPEYYTRNDVDSDDLVEACREDKYVYAIINVHNNEHFLIFGTNQSGFYVYSKLEKSLKKHPFILNTQYQIASSRMLNVDYSDNQVAFIISTDYLYRIKENSDKLDKKLAELMSDVKPDDNDLLMICEFK